MFTPTKQTNSQLSQLASGAGIMVVGRVVGRAASMAVQAVVARWAGTAAFGLYSLGWTIMRLLGLVAPMGLDRGVVRFGSQPAGAEPARLKALLFQSILTAFAAGSLIAAALYFSADSIERHIFRDPGLAHIIRWFALVIPFASVLRVATSATTISRKMQYGVYAEELIFPLTTLLLVIVAFAAGWGLTGAIAAMIAGTIAAMLAALVFVRRLYPAAFRNGLKQTSELMPLLRFSVPASLAAILTTMLFRVDRMIIGLFRPAVEVGQYQVAAQLTLVFALLASGFGTILSPMAADLHSRGERSQLKEIVQAGTRWTLYGSIPVFLVFFLDPGSTVAFLFGKGFEPATLPLVILTAGQVVTVATAAVPHIIIMSGNERLWVRFAVPTLILNVLLDLFLIPRWGLVGAAAATTVSQALLFGVGLWSLQRRLGLWPFDRTWLPALVASVAGAAAILAVGPLVSEAAVIRLPVLFLVAMTVSYPILWALAWKAEDRELVRALIDWLRNASS